jgi:hypothetical protein
MPPNKAYPWQPRFFVQDEANFWLVNPQSSGLDPLLPEVECDLLHHVDLQPILETLFSSSRTTRPKRSRAKYFQPIFTIEVGAYPSEAHFRCLSSRVNFRLGWEGSARTNTNLFGLFIIDEEKKNVYSVDTLSLRSRWDQGSSTGGRSPSCHSRSKKKFLVTDATTNWNLIYNGEVS